MISRRTRLLLDRLAGIDIARRRFDRPAIERAIAAHLETLALPSRPVLWAEDCRAGFSTVARHPCDSAWDHVCRSAAHVGAADTWIEAWDIAADEETARVVETALTALNAPRWRSIRDAAWAGAWAEAESDERDPRWGSSRAAAWNAAAWAVGQVHGRILAGRASDVADDPWLPFLDAYEAGLFLFWIVPSRVVCVRNPMAPL